MRKVLKCRTWLLAIVLFCRYAIMWQCWQQDPESRPTFLEIGKSLHRLMTAQKVSITEASKLYILHGRTTKRRNNVVKWWKQAKTLTFPSRKNILSPVRTLPKLAELNMARWIESFSHGITQFSLYEGISNKINIWADLRQSRQHRDEKY